MNNIPRRSIEELLARYENEPNLQDVYVEGLFDKELFSVCLEAQGKFDEVIYDIDSVDVPKEILEEYSLTSGNKQRVIALAKRLSVISGNPSYRCIVDRDLDHWFSELESVPRLVWTDYASIELYFFTNEILGHILIKASKAKITDFELYVSSVIEVLKVMYAMRLVDKELGWAIEWLDPLKQLSVVSGEIRFNVEVYVRRLLDKNRRSGDLGVFQDCLDKWRRGLTGDPRGYIRGHDFVEMLAWTVKEFRGVKELQTSVAMERILVLIADRASDMLRLVR